MVLLLLAAIPALLTPWLHPKRAELTWTKPDVAEVVLSDIERWTPPPLWVDARTVDAYQKEHVPGAILLNEDKWEQLLPGFLTVWRPDVRVIVYCDSQECDASRAVVLRLQRELNLSDVFVLKGGWTAWKSAHH